MTEPPGPGASRPAIRLPPHFAARAREVLDGTVAPVTPRDAATVMLLRQATAGLTCAPTFPVISSLPSAMGSWPAVYTYWPVRTAGTYAASGAGTDGSSSPSAASLASGVSVIPGSRTAARAAAHSFGRFM